MSKQLETEPLHVNERPSQQTDIFAYEPRRITADPVLNVGSWTMKPYRLAAAIGQAEEAVATYPMASILADALPPCTDARFHRIGFAILHEGRDGTYLLVARWYAGHNLASDTYRITTEMHNGILQYERARLDLHACIWEMGIYAFERDAWVRTIMLSGNKLAAADAYLSCRIEGYL